MAVKLSDYLAGSFIGYTGSKGAGYTGSQGVIGYTGSRGIIGYTGSVSDNAVLQTSSSGSAWIPKGTEAQREVSPEQGYLRFNTDTDQFEGYDGTEWGTIGGGAELAASDSGETLYYIPMSSNASGEWTDARVDSSLTYDANTDTLSVVNITASGDIMPASDNASDIGAAGTEWKDIYCETLQETSSESKKENIKPLRFGLREVLAMGPIEFNRIGEDPAKVEFGFSSDRFHALGYKPLVSYNKEGKPSGLNYTRVVAPLTNAVGELYNEFSKSRMEILELLDSLKKEIKYLREYLNLTNTEE